MWNTLLIFSFKSLPHKHIDKIRVTIVIPDVILADIAIYLAFISNNITMPILSIDSIIWYKLYLKYLFLLTIVSINIVIFATQITIGIPIFIDQPSYPIILSIKNSNIKTATVCKNTCDAILTLFLIEYKDIIQAYIIPNSY